MTIKSSQPGTGTARADIPGRPPSGPLTADRILDLLIAPIGADAFFEEHWELFPLLVTRDDENRFAPLITRGQVEAFLEGPDLRRPPVRLARLGGVETSAYVGGRSYGDVKVTGCIDSEAMFREYANGASIVIDRAHEIFPSLSRGAAALQRLTGLAAQASIFVTPPRAQSFPVHFDPSGVFVIQVAGRKLWRLFDQPARWPLQRHYDPDAPLPDHSVSLEAELTPGCVLYVPRGHYHQVVTTESESIHVSLGVVPQTWDALLRRMVERLTGDEAFRAAPASQVACVRDPERLRREYRSLLDEAKEGDPMSVLEDPPPTPVYDQVGRLADLRRVGAIGPSTLLRLRPDREPAVERHSDRAVLRFGVRSVSFPPGFETLLDRLSDGVPFRPSDLGDLVEVEDAVELAGLLVREGMLTFEDAGGRAGEPQA